MTEVTSKNEEDTSVEITSEERFLISDLCDLTSQYMDQEQVKEVYRTGDCVAPRGIDMAIIEGRRVGEAL